MDLSLKAKHRLWVGLPNLAKKNTRFLVRFEFRRNNKKPFSIKTRHTYTKKLFVVSLKLKLNSALVFFSEALTLEENCHQGGRGSAWRFFISSLN